MDITSIDTVDAFNIQFLRCEMCIAKYYKLAHDLRCAPPDQYYRHFRCKCTWHTLIYRSKSDPFKVLLAWRHMSRWSFILKMHEHSVPIPKFSQGILPRIPTKSIIEDNLRKSLDCIGCRKEYILKSFFSKEGFISDHRLASKCQTCNKYNIYLRCKQRPKLLFLLYFFYPNRFKFYLDVYKIKYVPLPTVKADDYWYPPMHY